MPLTGRLLRTKTLARQGGEGCLPAIVSILLPECSDANRLALLSTEQTWREQAEAQPASQQERARLAVDTAWIASQSHCRPGRPGERGRPLDLLLHRREAALAARPAHPRSPRPGRLAGNLPDPWGRFRAAGGRRSAHGLPSLCHRRAPPSRRRRCALLAVARLPRRRRPAVQ